MAALSEQKIADLLEPYLGGNGGRRRDDEATRVALPALCGPLSRYLDLLLAWNARTNLTAIRSAEEIVTRHFGESLIVGRMLAEVAQDGGAALDFGSGAGFPGLPVQLFLPKVRVTLAESQGKKAAFLREATRVLGVPAEVWAKRVEEMPAERRFDAVMLRAVDQPERMLPVAAGRLKRGGFLIQVGTTAPTEGQVGRRVPGLSEGWVIQSPAPAE